MHDVPANVRAELARAGKNQGDLANLLGVTRQAVSRRLTGEVPFDVDELRKVADYLNVTPADLLLAPKRHTEVAAS